MSKPLRTTTELGNCQICERDQKLHKGLMVHHGYQRPGHGMIEGDCYGVGLLPYEVTCKDIQAWVERCIEQLAGYRGNLCKLQDRAYPTLDRQERDYSSPLRNATKTVTYRREGGDADESRRYEQVRLSAIHTVEMYIRMTETTITRCERRIAAWAPAAVRVVDLVAERKAKDDAAKAKIQAKKDARAALLAAQAARREEAAAKEAARKALETELAARFTALADKGAPVGDLEVTAAWAEVRAAGIFPTSLRVDDALVKLGLARKEGMFVYYQESKPVKKSRKA